MKINANFKAFASAHFDATKYLASPSLGVNRFMLDRVGNEMARATTIVEYQPNSHFPQHSHVGGEEYLVLSGTFHDEHGTYPVGTYVRNPIGSQHAPWVQDDGCVILVKLLQMAENEDSATMTNPSPLRVNIDRNNNNNDKYQPTLYGSVLDLYHNPQTGECVLQDGSLDGTGLVHGKDSN
jgi:anti-sigma factor ChrR (cupin superfamily)